MKVITEIINKEIEEDVTIHCHQVNDEINEIIQFIDSREEMLVGYDNNKIFKIPLKDIFYIEAVDNHAYAYLSKQVYELKIKLYEFENNFERKSFFRCSKNTIVNLMKIDCLKPALNGRFAAILINGENIIISRKYTSVLRERMKHE